MFLFTEKVKILAFADHLFQAGEYYRAITEYSRFLFFFPEDPLAGLIRLKVAYAYQKGAQWEDAGQRFEALFRDYADQEIGREACFQSAETLRLAGDYRGAIERYDRFIEAYPEDERVDLAHFRIGCLRLEGHDWLESETAFSKVREDSQLLLEAAHLGREARRLASLPLKNPALAGTLSALIPGCGQVYAGRYRDGLTAFLVNGGFIWGAAEAFDQDQTVLGGILLFIEFGWYAGNVYSAVNSTRKFNQRKIEQNLTPLRERCSFSLSTRNRENGKREGKARMYRLSFKVLF